MPVQERRFFLCTGQCVKYSELYKYPDSHILGELRYLTDEGRRVTALALYLVPTCATEVPPLRPKIVLNIIGDARGIECRGKADDKQCANVQRWELGRAGFLALIDRMGLQDKLSEIEKAELEKKVV